ncbi:transcription factor kayak [Drosophila busckii]|uniref:transcription factor kayak n=1 Tax=Drosophila busckii TaxID=30019 RepID=UPI00083EB661|nr:transcription factor kayak [Drosophila busckii]
MAPTVCSEKKMRIEALKEVRRQSRGGVSQSSGNTTQHSRVLNLAAKGSTNLAGRQQQRRRLFKLRQNSKAKAKAAAAKASEQKQLKQMELDELPNAELSKPQMHTHSSKDNIKTVLQPTIASNSNCHGDNSSSYNSNSNNNNNNNKMAIAKFCDQVHGAKNVFNDDADSGFDISLEPVRQQDRLLSIAIKTIKLVQRNKLLQKRLAQLQLETSAFIASVLDNPENRHLRDNLTAKKSLRH